MSSEPSVWVFGYGSLCWHPGFEYSECIVGYVRGYLRRFWQGNTTHRGTEDNPGRVATLVPDKHGLTYGCAFKVTGPEAIDYLANRECSLGGYLVTTAKFYPHVAQDDSEAPWNVATGETFPVQLYIATEHSRHWMGEASTAEMAKQIVNCRGPSGHNVEYVLRLAQYVRTEIPEIVDSHLFELETLIHKELQHKQINLTDVMGRPPPPHRRRNAPSAQENSRRITFEHRSRVASRNLRCLQI